MVSRLYYCLSLLCLLGVVLMHGPLILHFLFTANGAVSLSFLDYQWESEHRWKSSGEAMGWCDFESEGVFCSTRLQQCTYNTPKCKWISPDSPTAVIFSDRLMETGMMTMASLCRHASHLHVLVVMDIKANSRSVPHSFLNCTVITMQLIHALVYLRKIGWHPDAVCDGPGRSDLGEVISPTLLGAADWDKDPKHSSCSNHLRFYLAEFPVFARHKRVLFVDDDVVIQRDPAELFNMSLRPGVVFTANCDVNLWNEQCKRFGVSREVYRDFFDQAIAPEGSWNFVVALLQELSGGSISYDPHHIQWNFGFNLINLGVLRTNNLSHMYEHIASQVLLRRYLRGDSLIYGLGIPFLVFSGRITCYERSGWYVLDGLGYVPPAEMHAAGVSMETIRRAAVLHYNGERKPWGKLAFNEYMDAMGDWGQSHLGDIMGGMIASSPVKTDVTPLQLVVLLSGPRTGTEWLAKVMSDDADLLCGSIGDRSAPHPEALIPFDVACQIESQVPCRGWKIKRPTNESCDLRRMCLWRYIIASARGALTTDFPDRQDKTVSFSYEEAWRAWGRDRNASTIFEGYLRRMMRLPTTAPEIPCRCEPQQKAVMLKFFLGWLQGGASTGLSLLSDSPFLRRFTLNSSNITSDEGWDVVEVLPIFRRLQAKIIFLHRDPITQYLSIQRARQSELKGSDAAWHCFGDASSCNKTSAAKEQMLTVDVRDAGHFVLEAERLKRLALHFAPSLSWSFENCSANAIACIHSIYNMLGLPTRTGKIVQPRVSSKLSGIKNVKELKGAIAAIKAGAWNASDRVDHPETHDLFPGKSFSDRGRQRIPADKIYQAVRARKHRMTDVISVGGIKCPQVETLRGTLYPLFAQIHRNRLAGLLVNPEVLSRLTLICVIGIEPAPSKAIYGLRGQVSNGNEDGHSEEPYMDTILGKQFRLPEVLDHLHGEARRIAGRPLQMVLYSNPRGSNPSGADACTSYRELERSAKAGGGAMSWFDAGKLDVGIDAHATSLVLLPPKLAGQNKTLACLIAPSHPLAVSGESGSICHADTTTRPPTGWPSSLRNKFFFLSLIRVGIEVMSVLNATVSQVEHTGFLVCRLTVQRSTSNAQAHDAGEHVLAPVHLDTAAPEATCESPVQYALDYLHPSASDCIERHLEHALAVRADGTWLDNMGPNLVGAMTSAGVALNSYDLRYPTTESTEPCPTELEDMERTREAMPAIGAAVQKAELRFKECRFSSMIKAQGRRVNRALDAIQRKQDRRALAFGSGLRHSFYWSDSDMKKMIERYQKVKKHDEKQNAPFVKNTLEHIFYFNVNGIPKLVSQNGSLSGFSMDSFFGLMQVSQKCKSWPTGSNVSLESCGMKLEHPSPDFWHADARVLADASSRGWRVLAKVGQSGWKSVGQEYLSHATLHRWVVSAYASFLVVAPPSGPQAPLMLGVHPFARLPNGSSVWPWLHPIFTIDLGQPNETASLLEEYRVQGHSTYTRRFEYGIALFNPYPEIDHDVPLGHEYIDPWSPVCRTKSSWTVEGQSGMVLVKARDASSFDEMD